MRQVSLRVRNEKITLDMYDFLKDHGKIEKLGEFILQIVNET